MRPEQTMKAAAVTAGVLGVLAAFVAVPLLALRMRDSHPGYAYLFWPMLIYAWIAALPGLLALRSFFGICTEIGRNNSFSRENARALHRVFRLLMLMAAILVIWALHLLAFRLGHLGVILALLGAAAASALLGVLSNVLSLLVGRAAELKAENDLTI